MSRRTSLPSVGRTRHLRNGRVREAVETARAERVNSTSSYRSAFPLLADYLEEGLEKWASRSTTWESDVL